MHTKETLVRRFWNKVDVRGEDDCWVWAASLDSDGYGQIGCKEIQSNPCKAHRLSWFFAYGEHPEPGLLVCHSCDTRSCVNPKHLFLGTPKDNSQDAAKKMRFRNKLTPEQVREIRARREAGETLSGIAKDYGIGRQSVFDIHSRHTWSHVS